MDVFSRIFAKAMNLSSHAPGEWYLKIKTDGEIVKAVSVQVTDPTWAQITNKPSTFSPSVHSHSISDVTSLQSSLDGKKANFSENTSFNKNFGIVGGTVAQGNDSRILDAVTAFNWGNHAGRYSLLAHVHTWGQITEKPTTFEASAHTHTFASLTNKPTTLAGYGISNLESMQLAGVSANTFVAGTGDSNTFASYNFALSGWNSMAFFNPTAGGAFQNQVSGLVDFRNGIINMKGGFQVNGQAVWHAGTFNPALFSLSSHVHTWAQITNKPNTSGLYLRGTGSDLVMSAIQASDVPTLNQNTTGTSANVASGAVSDYNEAWVLPGTSIINGFRVYRADSVATNKPITLDNANWLINIYSHPSGGVSSYGHQLAAGDTNDMYFRQVLNGSFGAWNKFWHSGNFNPGEYPVLRSAGDTGTGAVKYNGIVRNAGEFYGGSTTPINTTILNFDGLFRATRIVASDSIYSEEITLTLSTLNTYTTAKTFDVTEKKIFTATVIPTTNETAYLYTNFAKLYNGSISSFYRVGINSVGIDLRVDSLNGNILEIAATGSNMVGKTVKIKLLYLNQ